MNFVNKINLHNPAIPAFLTDRETSLHAVDKALIKITKSVSLVWLITTLLSVKLFVSFRILSGCSDILFNDESRFLISMLTTGKYIIYLLLN